MSAEDDRRALARLAHDVGKSIARAAHNLPETAAPLPAPLLAMLMKDLYALEPGLRASAVFASRSATLSAESIQALAVVRAWLLEIDALEAAVRAGEPAAITRAAQLALEVEARLRALARGEVRS